MSRKDRLKTLASRLLAISQYRNHGQFLIATLDNIAGVERAGRIDGFAVNGEWLMVAWLQDQLVIPEINTAVACAAGISVCGQLSAPAYRVSRVPTQQVSLQV